MELSTNGVPPCSCFLVPDIRKSVCTVQVQYDAVFALTTPNSLLVFLSAVSSKRGRVCCASIYGREAGRLLSSKPSKSIRSVLYSYLG